MSLLSKVREQHEMQLRTDRALSLRQSRISRNKCRWSTSLTRTSRPSSSGWHTFERWCKCCGSIRSYVSNGCTPLSSSSRCLGDERWFLSKFAGVARESRTKSTSNTLFEAHQEHTRTSPLTSRSFRRRAMFVGRRWSLPSSLSANSLRTVRALRNLTR